MSRKPTTPDVTEMFEQCVGCKWTLHLLGEIRRGRARPGELTRSAAGLTTKVMNERLVKLVRFGVLEKRSYPEKPPRVEYGLSVLGKRFVSILDDIDRLRHDLASGRVVEAAPQAKLSLDGQGALPLVAAPPVPARAGRRHGGKATRSAHVATRKASKHARRR